MCDYGIFKEGIKQICDEPIVSVFPKLFSALRGWIACATRNFAINCSATLDVDKYLQFK
jgi:hypothetical protein